MGNTKSMSGDKNYTDGTTGVPSELTSKLLESIRQTTEQEK